MQILLCIFFLTYKSAVKFSLKASVFLVRTRNKSFKRQINFFDPSMLISRLLQCYSVFRIVSFLIANIFLAVLIERFLSASMLLEKRKILDELGMTHN